MSLFKEIRTGARPPAKVWEVRHKKGNTADIINTIMFAEQYGAQDTAPVAHLLRGKTQKESAEKVWRFVHNNIKYRKDPPGDERIKSPSVTLRDGYGDCKSMSLLVGSFLTNLGIPHVYRYGVYDGDRDYVHVYVVAYIGKKEVPIDATYDLFGSEVEPVFHCDLSRYGESCPTPRLGGHPGMAAVPKSWLGAALVALLSIVILNSYSD